MILPVTTQILAHLCQLTSLCDNAVNMDTFLKASDMPFLIRGSSSSMQACGMWHIDPAIMVLCFRILEMPAWHAEAPVRPELKQRNMARAGSRRGWGEHAPGRHRTLRGGWATTRTTWTWRMTALLTWQGPLASRVSLPINVLFSLRSPWWISEWSATSVPRHESCNAGSRSPRTRDA